MPPYSKYLIKNISTNLILYYLMTISTFIISILTAFIALISLSLYPFNNSFASDLSDKRIEINPFPEYDISSMRIIFIFNSNIKSIFDILFNLFYLVNINLFEVFIFFTYFFSYRLFFFYIVFYWF